MSTLTIQYKRETTKIGTKKIKNNNNGTKRKYPDPGQSGQVEKG